MKHRPRIGGMHTAPLVLHPARCDWAALRPQRPTLRKIRAVLRSLHGWNSADGIRLT